MTGCPVVPGTVKVHGDQWGGKGLAEAPSRPSVPSRQRSLSQGRPREVRIRTFWREADASGLHDHWTVCPPLSLFSPLFILESSGVGESKARGESGEPCWAGPLLRASSQPLDLTSLPISGLPLLPPNSTPLSYTLVPQH